jgi:hypothetical protein
LPQFRNHSELLSVRKLWEHFQLLPLYAWLYHTTQCCYITHIWEYIIPHFTLRTQQNPLFTCFWELKQLKLVYRSLSLGSHITFDSF